MKSAAYGIISTAVLAALLAIAAITFAESKAILVQIELDRAGFSCNAIDGSWGPKSARALSRYASAHALSVDAKTASSPEAVWRALFPRSGNPYRHVAVTQADLDSLVKIPASAADKARLPAMGYESVAEMFAERGHLSRRALERLNPKVDWSDVRVGTRIRIPDFPSMEEELSAWPRDRPGAPSRPVAKLVRISLSRCEVSAFDENGRMIASYPCSIARSKAKLPPHGELRVSTTVAHPNYTYTPDGPAQSRGSRHVWPAGPNCPVGVAWIGLSLPGYGIHGTPRPETIGSAESHGCFRLSNWNAARLYAMVKPGTKVVVEE